MNKNDILELLRRRFELLLKINKEFKLWRLYRGNLRFHNCLIEPPSKNWFYRFCTHRNIPRSAEKKLTFFQVFGHPLLPRLISGNKVFFSGENLNGPWGWYQGFRSSECLFDLVLGFDLIQDHRHMRFPLWLMYLVKPEDSLEELKERIACMNAVEHRNSPTRTKFACIMARHDSSGLRSKLSDFLEQVAAVTYPGKFRNNTDELKSIYGDDKQKYLRNFRFNICPENSATDGYITEKLFESFLSGCIPIYWGGALDLSNSKGYATGMLNEADIVDERAFLRFDEKNPEALWQQVNELEHNRDAYEAFIAIPPFKEGAAERIWDCLQELEKRLVDLSQ